MTVIKIDRKCNICGKDKMYGYNHDDKNLFICSECIGRMYAGMKIKAYSGAEYLGKVTEKYDAIVEKFTAEKELEKRAATQENSMRPSDIKDFLDQYIIGQDTAKKVLSVALYNHYKRINTPESSVEKSNILMLGPTGCGKTLLAKTLAKKMDVPFTVVDATDYSETGYVGKDVESILTQLLAAADNDVMKAEKGIIYIDEFDKIATKATNSSNTHDLKTGVQQSLLKLIEGSVVELPMKLPGAQPVIRMNTKNILFICGGSFAEFEKKETVKTVGFIKSDDTVESNDPDAQLSGIIPELMGRLPVIVKLNPLEKEDLLRILTEPKNCIVNQYKELFAYDGIDLEFTDDALKKVVEIAMEKQVGARGLRRVIEHAMQDIMFDAPSMNNISKCIVTKDTILNGTPVFEYRKLQESAYRG